MSRSDPARWRTLQNHLQQEIDSGHCRAISVETGSAEGERLQFSGGHLSAQKTATVHEDSIFLIASPTKPIVAVAAMMLVERGLLQLDRRAQYYLPEFQGGGKESIRLSHLLTHTSGLPDMLPNNQQLRQQHAPLSEFMQGVYALELGERPGTKVQYQSMGILTLATILEKVTAQPLPEFLQQEIFQPLQMNDTALGIPAAWETDQRLQRMAWSRVEDQPGADEWGWNSDYWRKLGAPWGGLLSTALDLGKLCRHLLQILQGETGVLAPPTMRAMISNQLTGLKTLPESVVRATPWGFGWQRQWPAHPRGFGSLLPRETFGHWGATGTLVWLDPTRFVYGIALTTEPLGAENRRPVAFANLSALTWRASSC